MKKTKFNAPGRVFDYRIKVDVEGHSETLSIKPGDKVFVDKVEKVVSEEYINELYSITHRIDLDDRYYEDNRDKVFDDQKKKQDDSSGNTGSDPFDTVLFADVYGACHMYNKAGNYTSQVNHDSKVYRALIAIEAIKDSLTEAQLDLLYDMYGKGMGQSELARKYGVSKQAIDNRKRKMLTRIKKLLAERGVDEDFFD